MEYFTTAAPCDFGTVLPEAYRVLFLCLSVVLARRSQNWLVSVKNNAEDPGDRLGSISALPHYLISDFISEVNAGL